LLLFLPKLSTLKFRILALSSLAIMSIAGWSNNNKAEDIVLGKKLYCNCSPCHFLFKEGIAAPMYGALERAPGKKWIYDYISNPSRMPATDSIAKCLKEKYGSLMTVFELTNQEIDAIYSYVYDTAKKRKDVWGNKSFFTRCK
jgi:hypothetical protein